MTSGDLMFEGAAAIEWHGRLLIAGTIFSDAAPRGPIWSRLPGGRRSAVDLEDVASEALANLSSQRRIKTICGSCASRAVWVK